MRLSRSATPDGGPRLLAPGLPDWIGTDGLRVGWTLRDRLFLLDEAGITVVELPDLAEEVLPTPHRWTVALGSGFVRIDPALARIEEVLVDDEAEPLATWPGAEVALFIEVPEHRLLRLGDGRPLPLPDGALRARWIRPWTAGFGACWVDGELLWRTARREGLGPSVAALGRVVGVDGLACGPDGAVLVRDVEGTLGAAPGGVLRRFHAAVDPASARFSPDGTEVIVSGPDSVFHLSLTTGDVRSVWRGDASPVGFFGDNDAVVHDVATGRVCAGARVWLEGVAAARPASAGALLAGPGGAVWALATGARLRNDLRDGVCATDGVTVVHVTDTDAHVLGGATFPHGLCHAEDSVHSAALAEGVLTVTTLDGEVARLDLSGRPVERSFRRQVKRHRAAAPPGVQLPREGEDSVVVVDGVCWPIPGDGAARVGDEVWVWTDEGALFALPWPRGADGG